VYGQIFALAGIFGSKIQGLALSRVFGMELVDAQIRALARAHTVNCEAFAAQLDEEYLVNRTLTIDPARQSFKLSVESWCPSVWGIKFEVNDARWRT
jgi:hypothetical protein